MYPYQDSTPRLRSATIHRQEFPLPRHSPPPSPSYVPYLPPPNPTFRSRSKRWYQQRSLTRLRTFLKYTIPLLAFVFLLALYLYEPHLELSFYSRSWIHSEITPTPPPLAGCFSPTRVSPSYNVSERVYGPKHTEVQAGLSLRFGMDCYAFAGTIQPRPRPASSPPRTLFHTYWRTDLVHFGPRQEWMIKSFFATQDLRTSRLLLWSNGDLSSNPILKSYLERYPDSFGMGVVDMQDLAIGTALEGSMLLGLKDGKAWLDGDLLRLLLLWNYGGIWIDMDSLLTRDLSPLLEHEFVTQWDCYDKPYLPLNGALMHFALHSPYLCEALHIISTSPPPRAHSTDWGSLLYLKLHRRLLAEGIPPFKVLPFCFSDGRSCRLDNRLPDPFVGDRKDGRWGMGGLGAVGGGRGAGGGGLGPGLEEGGTLDRVLGMVFGVHLHNQWDKSFPKNGWVERLLLRRYDRVLRLRERGVVDVDFAVGEEGE